MDFTKIENLMQEYTRAKQEVSTLKNDYDNIGNSKKDTDQYLARCEQNYENAKTDYDLAREFVVSAENDKNTLQNEYDSVVSKLENIEDYITRCEQNYETANNELELAYTFLESAKNESETFENKEDTITYRYETALQEIETLDNELNKEYENLDFYINGGAFIVSDEERSQVEDYLLELNALTTI
jgi:chromosome segregation ATPase